MNRCTWCGAHPSDPQHSTKCREERERLSAKFPAPPRQCLGCKHVGGVCQPCTGFEPSEGTIELLGKILRPARSEADRGWGRVEVDPEKLRQLEGHRTYDDLGGCSRVFRVAVARGFCTRRTAERLAVKLNCRMCDFVVVVIA